MDFSGLESATDFLFYKVSNYLKAARKEEINAERIKLLGCKHATIWSLHYLNQTLNKTIFDFNKFSNVFFILNFSFMEKLKNLILFCY